MSVANDEEPAGPHDPLHYAPRRLRDRPEPRLAMIEETRVMRENKRLEAAVGRISTPAPLDSQLENAVYESLRRPMDPAILGGEPRALARELERRGALFGLAGRLAAAVGISAIIALFFVIMMPASRHPDTNASFSETVQSFTSALGQQQPAQAEEARKPALAEFQSLLGDAQAAEREQPDKQADKTLQQFLQWRQKAGETSP